LWCLAGADTAEIRALTKYIAELRDLHVSVGDALGEIETRLLQGASAA